MLGGLGIGITEFVMMGLLPNLSMYFHVSIPEAGYLITAYALGVVVGAPSIAIFAGRYPPKKLLLGLMVLFTLFNGISAFAPNFDVLLVCRFLSGLPHGAFFGVGSVVASRIAPKGKESQAVSMMFAGLTIANLFGVPLGTYIGYAYSWRFTFALIGLVGLITFICLKIWVPNLATQDSQSLREELKFFNKLNSWILILIISVGTAGLFSWFSYIAPMLIHVTFINESAIPYVMALAGLGMFVGNFVGGKLSDQFSPINALLSLLLVMTVDLILVHLFATNRIASLVMIFVTGATSFAMVAPIQMLMIRLSKGAEVLASSVSQACFNVGNALGAFLGGVPIIYGFGFSSPEFVGASMTSLGFIFVLLLMRRLARR